ncbi:MAG: response regulator [Lyngbya sp.]|nr:response regulator [Lyngbya sp.]
MNKNQVMVVVYQGKKTILIIDNQTNTREILQICLTDFAAWNVLLESSLSEGLQQAKLYQPDAVVFDFSVREDDVFWFAQKLRMQQSTEKIPVLLLTLTAKWLDLQLFQQNQVSIVVVNPFDLSQLPVQISQMLGWIEEGVTESPSHRVRRK